MKKILVVQGGGRAKGNTAQLIDSFVKGAEESGHSVEIISLLKNEVKGCLGCNACRYGKSCIQKDVFNDIVPKIKEADCIAEEDPDPPLGRYEKYPVKAWCLRVGVEMPMAGPRSIKRIICSQHMNLENVFINREDGMHHYDLTGI